jgi:hypothetical protein
MSEVKDLLASAMVDSFKEGVQNERDRTLQIANALICFEHHKGCEHAACYAINNLVSYIKEGSK